MAGTAAEAEPEPEAETELLVDADEVTDALWLAVEALDPQADRAKARAPATAV